MRVGAVVGVLAATLCASACGSSASSSKRGGGGTVTVLYAGSLVNLMERDLGPSFSRAEGYSFAGIGAGSTELVAQIKGHVHRGDVFVSASAKADRALEGATNGAYVDWYVSFARAPLVIGYSKTSRFADAFRSQPWWQVISDPAIRVGRTDPALDPKGKLTAEAITAASAQLRLPSLTRALGRFEVFPEESLVGRLESGQLDAGFFYSSEAAEQHIPAVGLAPVSASATYTATILAGAGDRPGAEAFLAYLLGPTGSATLRSHGLTVIAPVLSGSRSVLPASLRPLVP